MFSLISNDDTECLYQRVVLECPWQEWGMVEQDLLISRMLVELFGNEHIRENLVFRGGTALHKLFLPEPLRFSEDIDLVQRETGPIGPLFVHDSRHFSGMAG